MRNAFKSFGSANIGTIVRTLEGNLLNRRIRLIQRFVQCGRLCGHAQHSAAVGVEFAVFVLGAGMVDNRAVHLTVLVKPVISIPFL